MTEKIPEIEKRRKILDRALLVLATVAIVFSAFAILLFGGGSPTGFAVSEVEALSGSQNSDDALYYSFLISQYGRIDARVLENYERFSGFEDFLNFIYDSDELGKMEMSPLEIGLAEFSSASFERKYSPAVGFYNRMAERANEVSSGNRAAEESFLIEFYSFRLYIGGLSSGSYWRLSEIPGYEGLDKVRSELGDEAYQKITIRAYEMIRMADPDLPGFEEWA